MLAIFGLIVCVVCSGIVLLVNLLVRYRRPAMASSQEREDQQPRRADGGAGRPAGRGRGGLWVAGGGAVPHPERAHPLYKKLSGICGEVNGMTHGQMKQQLRELNMEQKGADCVLSKRLKNHLRKQEILQEPDPPWDLYNSVQTNPYGLDYLLVLDFEATCQEVNPPDFIHEIIEFPILMFSIKTLTVEAQFHTYCRPFLNPILTDFCKKLTGIRQEQVDGAPYFPEVFRRFTEWLEVRRLGTAHKFAVVTDCPWDINKCLFPQCVLSEVQFPQFATKWIDVRKLFSSYYSVKSGNLTSMLEKLALKFEGREHCGLHDSQNIVCVLAQLIRDGCVLKYNRFMPEDVVTAFSKKRQ